VVVALVVDDSVYRGTLQRAAGGCFVCQEWRVGGGCHAPLYSGQSAARRAGSGVEDGAFSRLSAAASTGSCLNRSGSRGLLALGHEAAAVPADAEEQRQRGVVHGQRAPHAAQPQPAHVRVQ
jgi:hypothetical protein